MPISSLTEDEAIHSNSNTYLISILSKVDYSYDK